MLLKDPPEPSLLQSKQSQLSQPLLKWKVFQSLHHFCAPSLDYLQRVHVSLVLGISELEHSTPGVTHQCWAEGKGNFPQPASCIPDASWGAVGPFYHKGTLLACAQLRVRQDLQVLFCQTASKTGDPQCVLFIVPSLCCERGSEISEIPFSHFTSLSRHLWMWAKPSGVSATPPSIMSFVNLQKVHSVPSPRSPIKLFNSSGCIISPWLHH